MRRNNLDVYKLGATRRCYNSWEGMQRRCYKPDNPKYKHYGARGITVCRRWHKENPKAFENFYRDMGNPPEGMSLDRINVNGNYEPKNCRWADKSTQSRTRRKMGSLTHFTVEEIASHLKYYSDKELLLIFRQIIKARK